MNRRMVFIFDNNTNILKDRSINDSVVAQKRHVKLALLLPCQVLSILCSLFIFSHIIYRPSKLIKPIRNHFIFILLITSFIQVTTELSMVENYLDIGIVRPSTNAYCLFFNWYEFTLNGISLFVMFWASLERHIIIFSHSIFHTRWKRLAFHYIPLSIATLYPPLIYSYFIFIHQCVNHWDYRESLCTAPCFYQNKILGSLDWLANIIIPAFAIALSNVLLVIRVVCRSRGLRQNIERLRKNRKMTIQLLATSSLFLIFWLPIAITGLIQQFFSPTFLIDIQFNIFFYLIYFIQLFLPMVCFVSFTEIKKHMLAKIKHWRQRNRVADLQSTFYT